MTACERLTWHYVNRVAQAVEQGKNGSPVAGVTSNTVPWELLSAAGFFPVLLSARRGPAPFADRFMEDVFDARIRGIFDGLASGAWPFLQLVVIPRTSEQEHKLYLYLREISRQGFSNAAPRVYLYNLLHTHSPEAYAYGLDRTHRMKEYLENAAGHRIGDVDLARAISVGNAMRQAIRKLLALRQGLEPRLTGTEALTLMGACYFMDRAEYAQMADAAAAELSNRPALRGVRLLVKGSALDHTGLHRALEAHGAIVVAEDDWWGSRSVSKDIAGEGDLVQAIFETYYRDTPSPRVFPPGVADEWFQNAAIGVDGVVFYLPPEDDVMGWDYPHQRKFLEDRGIPSLVVRAESSSELTGEMHERIEVFTNRIAARR